MNTEIHLQCEMLVDQNRYVGHDPVGYACSRKAFAILEGGPLICAKCMDMITSEPERITRPQTYLGEAGQRQLIASILQST